MSCEGWIKKKLADIADTQTGPFGSQLHNKDYVEHGTPIVTVEHLGKTGFTYQNLPRVKESDVKRLSKYTLHAGDIVFSRVGSVDRCSFVRKSEAGWLFSGRCLRVRARANDNVDPRYLLYFFKQSCFIEHIRSIAVGATMPSLNVYLKRTMRAVSCVPFAAIHYLVPQNISQLFQHVQFYVSPNKNNPNAWFLTKE